MGASSWKHSATSRALAQSLFDSRSGAIKQNILFAIPEYWWTVGVCAHIWQRCSCCCRLLLPGACTLTDSEFGSENIQLLPVELSNYQYLGRNLTACMSLRFNTQAAPMHAPHSYRLMFMNKTAAAAPSAYPYRGCMCTPLCYNYTLVFARNDAGANVTQ